MKKRIKIKSKKKPIKTKRKRENKIKSVRAQSMDAQYQYPGRICLDKEGRWFHEGVEITHLRTIELFSKSVVKDNDCGYLLKIGKEWAKIVVEDTPYMVRSVDLRDDSVLIELNDKSVEHLNPASLRVGNDNVLYCKVKSGEFPARFLRPAYYQLMTRLHEDKKGFYLEIRGQRHYFSKPAL
jgi:hypothetical protein